MKVEEDAPFAICFGCKTTLESVEQFRYTCRLHDTVLRKFREQEQAPVASGPVDTTAPSSNSDYPSPVISNTDGGEYSNATVTVEIPPTTDESADDSKDSSSSPAEDNMCSVCNLKLPSLREYKKHMKKTHFKVRGIVPCPFCPRRFRKDYLFKNHVLKHTDRPRPVFGCMKNTKQKKCRICKEKFQTGTELTKHEEEQHALLFECRLCFRRFATEQDKNVHKILHLAGKGQGKKYKCRICSRVFPNRHCLNIHVKKHVRCFKCLTCGFKFTTFETYAVHQTTVHQSMRILDGCSECGVVFKSKEECLNHLNSKHAAYDPQDLANDEFSDTEGDLPNGMQQPGRSQPPEPETVSVSSDDVDDFPLYMEEDADGDDEQESASRGVAITNRLEGELALDEAPCDSGFDLYGTAFQPQISISLIEELSD